MNYIYIYILVINLLTLLLFGIDKLKSKKKWFRISEKGLLLFCFLGGGVGGFLGMNLFKHKRQKWYFNLLVPMSIGLYGYLWFKFIIR